MFKWIPLSLFFLLPTYSFAHGSTDKSSYNATIEVMKNIMDLTPEQLEEHTVSTASMTINGEKVWINGSMLEAVRGWNRVYYRSLQEECKDCLPEDEDLFVQQADAVIAQTFFDKKIRDPFMEWLEHIVVGTADVGARLGRFALVSKVAAEIAETVIMKPAGGMHFFCHIIDAFILFGTRHMQTTVRSLTWAGRMESSALPSMVRLAFFSRAVEQAQRRVQFELGPVDIDEEGLKQVDMEGPNRWWGWTWFNGKREKWVREQFRLARAGKPGGTLSKREFLGGRMKRYLLIKRRRRGHSQFMAGSTPLDKALNHDVLWVLSVQDNILERSFEPWSDAENTARESLTQTQALPADEIRAGLAKEFSERRTKTREQAEFIDDLLKYVELVFNPEVSRKIRLFQARALENITSAYMYEKLSHILDVPKRALRQFILRNRQKGRVPLEVRSVFSLPLRVGRLSQTCSREHFARTA